MSDDDAAERLRTVLRAGAAGVRPTDDSLNRILARAHAENARSRRWLAPLAAVAAVAVVVAGAAVVLGTRTTGLPAGTGSQQPTASGPTASAPTPSQSSSISPSQSSNATGALVALPAYYGASFEGKVRLYREFRQSRASDPVAGSLLLMLSAPADTDYARLWPPGTQVTSLYGSGGSRTVKLSQPPLAPTDMAVQEVVYTVTAADPSVQSVGVVWPGGSAGPTARGTSWLVLAPVWILAPADAATVASPVRVSGSATVFEATVSWEVDRPDGSKVSAGTTMASIGAPGRGTWSFSVPLPKGTYVVKAWETSMKDGRATWTDTKTVTVR